MTLQKLAFLRDSKQPESVDRIFQRAATLAYYLAVFPVSMQNPNSSFLLPTLVTIPVLLFSLSGIAIGTMPYLTEFKTVNNLKLLPTDSLVMKAFLVAYLGSRFIAPIVSVCSSKRIANLVKTLAEYDALFEVKNKVRLVSPIFTILLLGSTFSYVANIFVAYPILMEVWSTPDPDHFTLPGLFGWRNSGLVAFVHSFLGRIYGEIAVTFLTWSMLFIGRVIQGRIEDIQTTLFEHVLPPPPQMKPDSKSSMSADTLFELEEQPNSGTRCKRVIATAGKQLKFLIPILRSFETTFGLFIMLHMLLSLIIMVMTVYRISISAFEVQFHKDHREIVSLGSAVALTCLRLMSFVECGESIAKAGKNLSTQVALIDTTKLDPGTNVELTCLRRTLRHTSFTFDATGYFILNRKLIPSIFTSILTFTVVLAQFRGSDS